MRNSAFAEGVMLELESTPTTAMREPVIDSGATIQDVSLENVCGSLGIEIQDVARNGASSKAAIERHLGAVTRWSMQRHPASTLNQLDDCSQVVGLGQG
jgi:hypothetical protein